MRNAIKGDPEPKVDADTIARFLEYKFRTLFGVTHEQYLDEPHENILWLLEMDKLMKELNV